ncbi:hypothetical protein [Sphingobacterium endophyticum]|uniref:hypothetical protein n=1 Tax=Sphingobacterium endophyticum TaxID=2546448 RepID=UPI0012E0D5E4|nr:hypothetical protein [Sphingobacterium endophyticum]
MEEIIEKIVLNKDLHAKWLNTLSFMENAGARKISACEDKIATSLIQLKHAAEEHRHAYYLKKQISKLEVTGFDFYKPETLLGGQISQQYLHRLDVLASKYLKSQFSIVGQDLKYAAYLFVTYAIEVRADELYPIYQNILSKHNSKVMVKSIILEEEGHLEEMILQLNEFDKNWKVHSSIVNGIEEVLFRNWMDVISDEIGLHEFAE